MSTNMSQYGAPLLTRKSEIANKMKESTVLFPLEVMGKYQRLKQITVRIELPVYRIENGRTKNFQKEYLAIHPDAPADLFTKDTDSLEAQRAQHAILRRLVDDEDLLKEFQKGTHQTEPIIVTNTGVVVNGNRRLCAWRTLYQSDPEAYKNFEFIDVAVLPLECDEKEIIALERRLQIQKTHRAEYKWHNKATMMKEEREAGVVPEVIAKDYDVSKKDVDILIGALEYAEMYLISIDKKDQWSLVDGDVYAFRTMVEERKKISDQGRKELFEAICFKLIETKDYKERLYAVIPGISENLDAIADALREKGLLPSTENEEEELEEKTDAPAIEDEDDDDLLGSDEEEGDSTNKGYSELATAVQTSDVKLGGLIKQITDEQKAIKAEQKNANFLLKTLASVSRTLWGVRSNGLNENTLTEGTSAHLEAIKEHIEFLEQWIQDHQA